MALDNHPHLEISAARNCASTVLLLGTQQGQLMAYRISGMPAFRQGKESFANDPNSPPVSAAISIIVPSGSTICNHG